MKIATKIILLIGVTIALGCSKDESATSEENKPEEKEQVSIQQFPNLLVDTLTWTKLKAELTNNTEAAALFDKEVLTKAGTAMSSIPYAVKELDANNGSAVQENAAKINQLAVKWLFMDKPSSAATQVLDKLVILITKWATINEPTDHTPRETFFLPIYEAYSIIRNSITEAERSKIDQWIELRYDYYKNLDLTGNLKLNNWSTIKLNIMTNLAFILKDNTKMEDCIQFFKEHIEGNIYGDGRTHDLDLRDAFAYHAYDLLFYAQFFKTIALSQGKDEALALYQWENSAGGSVKKCVQYWEPYMLDPANNPHIEFQNTNWDGDKTRGDYNIPYNPSGTMYVLDELAFIEDNCMQYVSTLNPSLNRYNWTLQYWVNSFR